MTQDSKFVPGRYEAEHATPRLRRFPTILNLCKRAGEKYFVSLKLEGWSGARTRDHRLSKQPALTTVLTGFVASSEGKKLSHTNKLGKNDSISSK